MCTTCFLLSFLSFTVVELSYYSTTQGQGQSTLDPASPSLDYLTKLFDPGVIEVAWCHCMRAVLQIGQCWNRPVPGVPGVSFVVGGGMHLDLELL